MQCVRGNDTPACRAGRSLLPLTRLPLLLMALAAAATAATTVAAQQAQPSRTADREQGSAYTTYRVINLAPGLLATLPRINARGQVSFSMQADGGAVGYFYDGNTVRDIGTLGGGQTLAADLNDAGQVTGGSLTSAGVEHAFVWRTGTGMLDIGTPTGSGESSGAAINRHGVVTGSSYADFTPRAFRWSASSGNESLGALTSGLGSTSFAGALNDAGLIAGSSDTADGRRHAFAWTRSTGIVDIDTLNSYDALVVAVGSNGEVAGNRLASLDALGYHPFLWTRATGMRDLGTGGGSSAAVLAMTPDLHMAGLINFGDDIQRAMSWTRSSGIRNLGTLGGTSSRADDVNAGGQVVGFAQNRAGDWRAFVWTAKQGMLDLNKYLRRAPPGLVVDDALAINDSGAIVATSTAGLVLLRPDSGTGCGCGHLLGPVVAPALVKAGTPLQASVAFVDEDRVGTRSVSWSWGDGSSGQAGKVSENGGTGNASASHSFSAPGIYRVTATLVDRNGRSTAVSHEVVVTAPAGGMAAGSGAVSSPAGAFRQAPLYAGTARFSLIAPLASAAPAAAAASMPARLHFDLPGLSFRSQDVRMLGRQGAQQVFEGSGTVRGAGNYRFRLATAATLSGGEPGRFAMKIWHTDPASKREVVDYDNVRAASGNSAGNGAGRLVNGSIVLE
jgi:probable HAF family extracellular repeat protein